MDKTYYKFQYIPHGRHAWFMANHKVCNLGIDNHETPRGSSLIILWYLVYVPPWFLKIGSTEWFFCKKKKKMCLGSWNLPKLERIMLKNSVFVLFLFLMDSGAEEEPKVVGLWNTKWLEKGIWGWHINTPTTSWCECTPLQNILLCISK